MYMPHFAYVFIFDGHLGCFHPLAIVNNGAVNMGVQITEPLLSVLLDLYQRMELLDHMVILFLIFRNCHCFP